MARWRIEKKMRDKSPRNVRGPGRMKETEKLQKIAAVSAHEARIEESLDRTRDIHFSSENNAFRYSAPKKQHGPGFSCFLRGLEHSRGSTSGMSSKTREYSCQ